MGDPIPGSGAQTPPCRGSSCVLMSEDAARKFARLSLEGHAECNKQSEILWRVLLDTMQCKIAEDAEGDYRYAAGDNHLHISRVWLSHEMDANITQTLRTRQTRQLTLRDTEEDMRSWLAAPVGR